MDKMIYLCVSGRVGDLHGLEAPLLPLGRGEAPPLPLLLLPPRPLPPLLPRRPLLPWVVGKVG